MMFVLAPAATLPCVAFIRGLAGKSKDNVGNFFADLVRITTRVLLPFSIIGGLLLVWQGVPQNLTGNVVVDTIEGAKQVIAMGPIAALEIIKHLGTNGRRLPGGELVHPAGKPDDHLQPDRTLFHDAPAGRLCYYLRQNGQRPQTGHGG